MPTAIEIAEAQYRAGHYKKAADVLWEVTFAGDDAESEARAALALATQLRDATSGALRETCEQHRARAEQALSAELAHAAAGRFRNLDAELRADPVRLARWAREAGLTWLRLESDDDFAAGPMRAAIAAAAEGRESQSQVNVIDLVEAEGWRLEQVESLFLPSTVQITPWRLIDVMAGGEIVEGGMRYLYLFRRADGESG